MRIRRFVYGFDEIGLAAVFLCVAVFMVTVEYLTVQPPHEESVVQQGCADCKATRPLWQRGAKSQDPIR